MVSPTGVDVVVDILGCRHASSGVKEGDSILATGSGEDRLDTPDDDLLVRSIVEIWADGNLHAQVGSNGHPSPGNHTGSQVLGHCDHSRSGFSERTLSTDGPLELTSNPISTNEGFPCHSVRARGSGGENTGTVVQVVVSITDDWGVIGSIEVVCLDGRLGEDHISVGVVKDVISYGKPDPTTGSNHAWAVGTGFNNVELISWADTTAEEDLGSPEGTSRKNNSSGVGGDIDDTSEAVRAGGSDLDTSNPGTSTDNLGDGRVDGNPEVGTGLCCLEICGQGTATLAIGEHEGRAGEGPVLLVGDQVGSDLRPTRRLEDGGKDIIGLLEESDAILRRIVCRRNSGENFVGGSNHVRRLPASREIIVPITIWGLEE